ncbi:MAG: DUF58 domain-containing protein [Vulcanimicrobiaceae bacterium]
MRPEFPALWLSARGVWVALGLAASLALASVVPALLLVTAVSTAIAVGFVAADLALGPRARDLRIARLPLEPVALRRPARARYTVANRARIGVRIGVLETPVAIVEFARETTRADVGAGEERTLEAPFVARERGRAEFAALYAWVENRIGLVRRRYRIEASDAVRVYPDLSAVERYGTLARRSTLVDAGLRRLRRRGAGTEFESLRDYQTGDAFRLVDWKATARRGRMTVAQYEIERSQTVVVALDCGRLMTPRIGAQRKFDYALAAALSVARIAQAAGDRVGLLAFAAKPLVRVAPRRGAAHVDALARAAYDLQPRFEEPDYETVFADLRARSRKRSLVVLFSDIFDPVTSRAVLAGLGSLVPQHLVLCVLANDGALADALETTPTSAAQAYRTVVAFSLAEERARAIATLRARGIIVVDVPAAKLTVALLDAYLDIKARGRL